MKGSGGSVRKWKEWKGGKRPYIKIIVIMVLIAVIPALITEFISDVFLIRTMKGIQISFLQNTSKVISQQIDDFFQEQKRNSLFLISNSPMRSFLQYEYEGQQEKMAWWAKEVQDMLSNSVMYENNVSYIGLADRNGKVVASSDPRKIGTDLSRTQMYGKMMNGESQYTEMLVDKNGKRSLKLAFPLISNGQVMGFLEKVIDFQGIAAYMDHKKIGDNGYLYLIGSSQGSLYHRQRDCIILPNGRFDDEFEMGNLIQIISGSTTQKSGVIRYRIYDRDITAAYETVPSLHWVVVAATDETAFVKAVDVLNLSVVAAGVLMGCIAAWLGYRFTRRSIKNYRTLSNAFASVLDDSGPTEKLQITDFPELLDYVNQTKERVRTVQGRVRMLEGSDCLTGLHNRLGMERFFAEELSGKKNRVAALLLDLDSISFLNEKKGAKMGTAVIGEIGQIVKEYIGDTCAAGRMSNEEFLIFYYDWKDGADPRELAEHLRLDVEDIIFLEQKRVFVTASIGLYFIQEGDDFDQIYERCADALFQAKKTNQNKIAAYGELLTQDMADGFSDF